MVNKLVNPPERSEFDHWVHDALNRLYDSPFLETHPLVEYLVNSKNLTGRRSQELRQVLVAAIQSLRPSKNVPKHSHDWRGYQILEQRFISGLNPNEVMQRMGMSRSLFYLEQARILESLVDLLWRQGVWATNEGTDGIATPEIETPTERGEYSIGSTDGTSNIDEEMLRLLEETTWETVSLDTLLAKLNLLVEPLAQASHVELTIDNSTPATISHASRVLLRQVLLSQVSGLLEKIAGGSLRMRTLCSPTHTGIELVAQAPQVILPIQIDKERQGLSLEASRRILAAMGGSMATYTPHEGCYEVSLTWVRAPQSQELLVVDDNSGMLDLFRRFLDGTPWEVLAASNGEQARKLLAEKQPSLVILDVILPEEDGWEVLISLKANPATREIPVIVCSAINEPQLMTSLGAAAYLPKPVTRLSLLKTLQPWNCPASIPATGSPEKHLIGE